MTSYLTEKKRTGIRTASFLNEAFVVTSIFHLFVLGSKHKFVQSYFMCYSLYNLSWTLTHSRWTKIHFSPFSSLLSPVI